VAILEFALVSSVFFSNLIKMEMGDDMAKFADFFEVSQTVDWIQSNGYKRVALQLPDSFVKYAFSLSQALQTESAKRRDSSSNIHAFETFVLADTSYGECCVDQIAASHNAADSLVHYGRSCLSRPTFLPTLLVFCDLGRNLSMDPFVKFISEKGFKRVFIELDVRYEGARDRLKRALEEAGCSELRFSNPPPQVLVPLSVNPEVDEEETIDYSMFECVLFVGPRYSPQLDRVAFACATLEGCEVYSLDTETLEVSRSQANRALAKRFVMVEKAKDASIIGILIGTMSVALFRDVLDRVKKVIDDSGRKSYSFVFGKLSPSKLANFPDVDAFVLVACRYNTLIDSKEFNKPIVTPYELEVALSGREWGQYAWDFTSLLLSAEDAAATTTTDKKKSDDNEDEEVHFSLASGKVIHRQRKPAVQTLALRYESPAANSLAERTFRGLDPAANHLTPAKAAKGQVGIASKLYQMDDLNKEQPR